MPKTFPRTPTPSSRAARNGGFVTAGRSGTTPGGRPGPVKARAKHSNAWVIAASCLLAAFTVFVLLDTFAIAKVQQTVQEADMSSIVATQDSQVAKTANADATASTTQDSQVTEIASAGATVSATQDNQVAETAGTDATIGEYSDDNMTIKVSSVRAYDTDIYVADIQVSSAEYLKTALAQNSYGRNLKDTTSNMAEANDAVLAINGDYYGFRDDGYVLRNGVLYRETASSGTDALVVYGDGSMTSVSQDSTTAQQLKDAGAWQVLSFGPTLVSDGEIAVDVDDEVSQSMRSNPRTAIGMISPLHYVVVVSDGRTGDNAGLSLYELAQVLVDNGATYAYNLDGGGSTTLYFNGEVINNPSSGHRSGERSVSDIVYFG